MNVKKLTPQNFDRVVAEAAEIVKSGGLVIVPFDTVYGIICDSRNNVTVRKIFEFKQRPLEKTIGLAVDSIDSIKNVAEITHEKFAQCRLPGPYTFILKTKENDLSPLCVKEGTIAVRVPDSRLIFAIAEQSDYLLAQTSANLTGNPACASVSEIMEQFTEIKLNKIDLIIDGGTITGATSSQIFDLTGEKPVEIAR